MQTLGPASVQYNDLIGTAAADEADRAGLIAFSKGKGIDTEKYFPVGVSFYSGEHEFESVSVYAVEKSVAGTFDEVEQYAKQHGGKVPCVKFDANATIAELFQHFKRLKVVLTRKFRNVVLEYDEP